MGDNRRQAYKNRTDNVVGAIDVRAADHFHIIFAGAGDLRDKCGDVLEDVRGKASLDHIYVVVSLAAFHHTQVIHESVTVEVQIGKHVGGIVQQILEVLDSG